MPTYRPPSSTSNEESDSPCTTSDKSSDSFYTAENSAREESGTIMTGKDNDMMDGSSDKTLSQRDTELTILLKQLEDQETRENNYRVEMEKMRADMQSVLSLMKTEIDNQNNEQVQSTNIPVDTNSQNKNQPSNLPIKPVKWPEVYTNKNRSDWPTTYGILSYIYQRDVEQRRIMEPSDFFMRLFSRAVSGTAKAMVTGQFQSMMATGKSSDALGFLQVMNDTFRDRNAEQNAAALFYACKQFRDESLSSFLPRFQQLLSCSPSAAGDEINKKYQLQNSLNKTTSNYLVGHKLPAVFRELVEFLSGIGSQIEGVGLMKTRNYSIGQIGLFDDGTRGIAGGKLLGANPTSVPASYQPLSNVNMNDNDKDCDGDTKMTGVNRTRAAWVSKQVLDHRRTTEDSRRVFKRLTSGQSRIQRLKDRVERVEEQTVEDIKAAKAMNGTSFVIDTLINNFILVPTLIDNGCDCLAAVSNSIVRKAELPRLQVAPRKLTKATNDNHRETEIITEMTKMELDIDGYRKTIYVYIIPHLSHGLILGKPWMEREDVVYHAKNKYIEIREAIVGGNPLRVWEKGSRQDSEVLNVSNLSAGVFLATIRRAKKPTSQDTQVFSVSLADIQKALAPSKREATSLENLPQEYREFASLFKNEISDKLPPHRPGHDHDIKLEQGKEIPWGPLYGMSTDELLILRKTLTELLDKNYIRASSSPAGAPVLFVRKPGGGLRFCVDYRALNAISRADRYPLPLTKETLAKLSKAKWFTKLDVRSAFHKLRIKEGDEWKTAFRTRFGLFEWMVMPFGLNVAPASFQRYINETLREYLDDFCSAYVDDVLIYTEGNLSEHRKHVRLVLRKLEEADLGLDITKCEFSVQTTKYLGFIISSEGKSSTVRMDPRKVKAILEWEAPTTTKGLRGFLGFANFYRGFIDGFSKICAPLTALAGKGTPWKWGDEQEKAFETLKSKFVTEQALAQWDPDRETLLEADCSGYALGGCLLQQQVEGSWKPVAYY
ncbi:hypothetical protein K3495_g4387 [Podosphaera aphanis]|nr:hypothetical protein K3495_g4387 [Podosphaera aphanis]